MINLSEYLNEGILSKNTGMYGITNIDLDKFGFNVLVDSLKRSKMVENWHGISLIERLHSRSYSDPWKAFGERLSELKDGYDGNFWCSESVPNNKYVYVFKIVDEKVYTITFNKSGRKIQYIRVDDLDKRNVTMVDNDKIKDELEKIFS